MSPRRTTKPERLLPALARLAEAVEQHSTDADKRDIGGVAPALRELGDLALWALPIRGVFVSNDEEVSVVIERIATRHLGLQQARSEFRKALATVEPFDRRDAIESAHNQIRSVSEEAYFYAGLAFGVTWTAG
jgi:hypothetical protein